MNDWQALDAFWNGFGIPAYDEMTAFTEGTQLSYPHITYESASGTAFSKTQLSANIWYRTHSMKAIKEKADEIRRAFEPYVLLKVDRGYVQCTISESIPFARSIASGDEDEQIKRVLIMYDVEFLHH